MTEKVRVIPTNDALIRSDNDPVRRIVNVRQLVERNVAGPFTVIRRSIVGHTAVAALADWYAAGAVIADVSIDIDEYKILSWPAVVTQRRSKFLPVACAVGIEQSRRFQCSRIERGPSQCVSGRILFQNDGAVARHSNIKSLRVSRRISGTLAHLDLLVTNHCIAPA